MEIIQKPTLILPLDIPPPEGEHRLETCADCRTTLDKLTKEFEEVFDGKHKEGAKPFPYCCKKHSNLLQVKEFNRDDFARAPEMAARKVVYTNQQIINNIDADDWYETITQYINLAVKNLGQMPEDCGYKFLLSPYLNYVEHLLEQNTDIKPEKKEQILEHLNNLVDPYGGTAKYIGKLIDICDKWHDTFPFGLSYFNGLKEQYAHFNPILEGPPTLNDCSGVRQWKYITPKKLLDRLLNLTHNLITQFNGHKLVKEGKISDLNQILLEVIFAERELELKQGYIDRPQSEDNRIIEMLFRFFKEEIRFLEKIIPLLAPPLKQQNTNQVIIEVLLVPPTLEQQEITAVPSKPPTPEQKATKADELSAKLYEYGFFELEKVKRLSGDGKKRLVELICINETSKKGKKDENTPYAIAMFDFLGFLKYLSNKYFVKKTTDRNKAIAGWLGIKSADTIRNNITSLSEKTGIDKERYTAHRYKGKVKDDYEKLK